LIAVFDSSVWISAFEFGGAPLEALNSAIGRHRIAICAQILSEVRSVLTVKFDWRLEDVNADLRNYEPEWTNYRIDGRLSGICRDPNDDMVLECAVRAGAKAIVTGDKDLLTLGEYEGIRIVTPRTFLDEFQG
jgi:putative PIN family toxin of toxin-antitoxin system